MTSLETNGDRDYDLKSSALKGEA
ncbi:hypothetical protein IL54_0110 [Sphingobium sp. ba1]|nr:hypothetical protein IL54_0110 [Sphingobium sp. ba1]